MVLDLIGELLPLALAVALSPFPVIAVILVLGSPRAASTAPLFAAGWLVGLSAVTALFLAISDGAASSGDPAPALGWLRVALGAALIVHAVVKWRARPTAGEEAPLPAWMASIDDLTASRAVGLGAALGGLNPKNLALAAAAGTTIGQLGLEGGETVVAGLVFVALGSSSVVGAVLAHLIAGERAAPTLGAISRFMTEHNTAIMVVVLLVIGAKVLGDGLGAI